MPKNKKFIKQSSGFYRSVVATALLANGVFQFVAPVLAEGTAAGQSISNTATATYEDPNAPPGNTINATSNTVTVTVAEVTGIGATADGISDSNGGTVRVGDVLTYNFKVTNIGNDPTKFNIPTTVTLTQSTAGAGTVGTIEYSTDGGSTWTSSATTPVTADPVPVYTPGQKIGTTQVDVGTVLVRVPVTITSAATPGTTIKVQLGNTPDPNTQNQPLNVSTATEELSTKDLDDSVTTDVDDPPVGGEKEASANQTGTVGAKDYALATLLKTLDTHNNNSTPSIVTDDIVTYGLSLNVANTAPTGTNITPAELKGIENINVDGTAGTYILISDAIPKGTDLNAVPTTTNGTNWEAVYTTDAVTTNANAANWKRFSTTPLTTATELATATRVGFINKAALTSIAPGTTVTGFSITVKVESTATAPLNIANIAQLFGGTNTANTPGTLPVYEESGDNQPSNYDGTVFPGTDSNGDGVPDTIPTAVVEDGYINDSTDLTNTGTDSNNDNTGSGSKGEANVLVINTSSLLNGPDGKPGALGPDNDNNKDFTNKSSAVPANTAPGTKIDPSAVTFNNTVENGGSASASIVLVPTPPATATDLPTGTTVKITDPDNTSNTATYTYDSSGSGSFTLTSGTPVSLTVAAGATDNYTVEVNLPAGTSLSTDTEKGYSAPITAFVDSDGDKTLDSGEATNITIDRVYTGFLKLVKLSRILDASGNPLTGTRDTQSDFETTPVVGNGTPTERTPLPGEIIEYLIRYKNIAAEDNTGGANNVLLNVKNLVITESGILGANSNWALDQDSNTIIDTSNIANSAADSVPGDVTITYFSGSTGTNATTAAASGTTQDSDVTKYVNTINVQIAPGVQRTFTFKRKVN